jgi:hypothetical protein
MSVGRIILLIVGAVAVAALVYTGVWHIFTQFVWQYPMLSWLPLLALLVVGFVAGSVRAMMRAGGKPAATAGPSPAEQVATTPVAPTPTRTSPIGFAWGLGILAFIVVLLYGFWGVLISPKHMSIDEVEYTVVDELPLTTQPRLLPRSGVDDDPRFRDAKEIHLVRDPDSGELQWTGAWQASSLSGPSEGVAVRPLDDIVFQSEIVPAGFDTSPAGITPGAFKGKAKLKHPFSGIQYPVIVPTGGREAFAMAPYVGYSGFPFRHPELKGVLVYHQDGELEDLTPEEAAARPELAATGRIVPESVARAEAEAIADSDEFEGEIKDAEDNPQPYLTSIDADRTVWITVINDEGHLGGVKAIVMTDSSTGETEVWPADRELVSTQAVINEARALPLKWEEERCCDSDGNSYTVTLREVVEPRLAFKDGDAYYMVSVVPTDDLALSREVEYTLLIDAESGKVLDQIDHVSGGVSADARLQLFFSRKGEGGEKGETSK